MGSKKKWGREYLKTRGCPDICPSAIYNISLNYKRRWLALRQDYLVYCTSPLKNSVLDVMLFDSELTVSRTKRAVVIKNSYRSLLVRLPSLKQAVLWETAIKEAFSQSQFSREYRFGAFCPPRENNMVKLLVDGHEYFSELRKCLLDAQEEIFISGWWITPDLPLARPGVHKEDQLCEILKARAEAGVKIFITVYREIPQALYNNSLLAKEVLGAAHPNIKIVRHPIQLGTRAVWYWSHHQKVLIIDHAVAFVGGLDICLGRYDRHTHSLSDNAKERMDQTYPGKDYGNPCVKDLLDVKNAMTVDHLDRSCIPRMPWHDVHCQIVGELVGDLSRHFVQLWNHVKTDKHKTSHEKVQFNLLRRQSSAKVDTEKNRFARMKSISKLSMVNRRELAPVPTALRSTSNDLKRYSASSAAMRALSPAEEDPDHQSSDGEHEPPTSAERSGSEASSVSSSEEVKRVPAPRSRAWPLGRRHTVIEAASFPHSLNPSAGKNIQQTDFSWRPKQDFRPMTGAMGCTVQFLRSCSGWSFGLPTKDSIYQAYLHAIRSAEKFVYIENQFFVEKFPTGEYRTEQIYIHSKAMVVDDKIAIIGSANINDRSMLGDRDSEVAVYIEQANFCSRVSSSSPTFAFRMRMRLWAEHFGLLDLKEDNEHAKDVERRIQSPESDDCFSLWKTTADKNTEIFRTLFGVLPCSKVKTWAEFKSRLKSAKSLPAVLSDEALSGITGRLVEQALEFLEGEDMTAIRPTSAALMPREMFL